MNRFELDSHRSSYGVPPSSSRYEWTNLMMLRPILEQSRQNLTYTGISSNRQRRPKYNYRYWITTVVPMAVGMAVLIWICTSISMDEGLDIPSSTWYHYHYVPQSPSGKEEGRNLLIVQTGLVSPFENIIDITSRPNRAYAKQWGIDYFKYIRDFQSESSPCHDEVILLNKFIRQHEEQGQEEKEKSTKQQQKQQRVYDAILFLPGDSIITDYDFDLIKLLPEDKLVAIATHARDGSYLDERQSDSRIFIWNLNHEDSRATSKIWLDFVNDNDVSCQDGNVLVSLLAVLEFQFGGSNPDNSMSPHVEYLQETSKNFLAPRLINFEPTMWSPSKSMKSNADLVLKVEASREIVATSVCYRNYPRCEVI